MKTSVFACVAGVTFAIMEAVHSFAALPEISAELKVTKPALTAPADFSRSASVQFDDTKGVEWQTVLERFAVEGKDFRAELAEF